MKTRCRILSYIYAAFIVQTTAFSQFPELVVQLGHSDYSSPVAFSSDGRYVVTVGADKSAKLWDVNTGREIRTFKGHSKGVTDAAISPDGRYIATGSADWTAKLWDITTGLEIRTFADSSAGLHRHEAGIRSVAFSPNGKYLLTASTFAVKLWDVNTGEEISTSNVAPYHVVNQLSCKNSQYVITVDNENTARLWETSTGRLAKTFQGHPSRRVVFVGVTSDSRKVVTGTRPVSYGVDDSATIWDVASGKQIRALAVQGLEAVSPDGKYLVTTGGQAYTARICDINTGLQIRSFQGQEQYSIQHAEFSPDGRYLATEAWTENYQKKIVLWDVSSGRAIRAFEVPTNVVSSVALSSDHRYIMTMSSDKSAKIWDLSKGKITKTIEGLSGFVISPDFRFGVDPGGMWPNDEAKIYDMETGKVIGTIWSCRGMIAFSPNSKYVAVRNRDKQNDWDPDVTTVLELATGKKVLRLLRNHTSQDVSFSYDETFLLFGPELWNISSGELMGTFGDGPAQFSHDDEYVVSGGRRGEVTVFEATSQHRVRTLKQGSDQSLGITSVSMSPDDHYVAYTDRNDAKILDFSTGKEVLSINPYTTVSIFSMAFSPDSRFVLTNSADVIKVWNLVTGEEDTTITGRNGELHSYAFSRDGKFMVTENNDATTKLWDLSTRKQLASFISVGRNGYAIVTPDGYYTSTREALKGVHFVQGLRVYTFENFDLVFNRPDIVTERLGKADTSIVRSYKQAYLKRLKKMQFSEDMLKQDFHLPEIEILTQNLPILTKDKAFTFRVRASDSKYRLDRLNVFVNGIAVFGTSGISLRNKKVSTVEQNIVLELSNGANKIQVSILNEKGVESLKQSFDVFYQRPTTKPDLYTVAIGVSKYQQSQYDLRYAAKDARDLAEFLKARGNLFDSVHTMVITDENATLEKIRGAREFLMRSKVDDQIILFLAGHGLVSQELDYYFAAYNTDFLNPAQNGLPYGDIETLVDGIPARKKLVLIDACHSGEIEKEEVEIAAMDNKNVKVRSIRGMKLKKELGMGNVNELLKELFADLRRGTGAVVLTSSAGAEYSYEDEKWQNGVFTYSVIEGLNKETGRAKVSDLINYVANRVSELTGGRQNPTMRRENLEYDFVIH